jgi:hypothetical protein
VQCERRVSCNKTKADESDLTYRHVTVVLLAGVVGAARTHAMIGNTRDLFGLSTKVDNASSGRGSGRSRRGPYDR